MLLYCTVWVNVIPPKTGNCVAILCSDGIYIGGGALGLIPRVRIFQFSDMLNRV